MPIDYLVKIIGYLARVDEILIENIGIKIRKRFLPIVSAIPLYW